MKFPIDGAAFYGPLGQIVTEIAPNTEADSSALLLDLLTAFGSAVGPGPFVRVGPAKHQARLFVVLVGETSRARKGTTRHEIRPIFDGADNGWSKHCNAHGLSSGEGLIEALRDPDDGETVRDKRLLVVEEEFSKVLKNISRDGNTLSENLRSAWDHGEMRTMTRHAPLKVSGAHVSVLAHITKTELLQRLKDTETANGFMNRFVIVAAKRSQLIANPRFDPDRLTSHIAILRQALDDARRIGELHRSAMADAAWERVYNTVEGLEDDDLIGALTGRAAPHMLRLSMIYALADGTNIIDVPHLEAAYAVWRYSDATVRTVFRGKTGDPNADRVYEAIKSAGDEGLTRTDISDLFSRNLSASDISAVLQLLIGHDDIVERPQGAGAGRPPTRYFTSPRNERNERNELTALPAWDELFSSNSFLSSDRGARPEPENRAA